MQQNRGAKPTRKGKSTQTVSLKNGLGQFKQMMLYTCTNCLHANDRAYFNAARFSERRLQPLAVLQTMTSIRGMPVVSDEVAQRITAMIIASKGKHITSKKLALLRQDNLILPLKI